MKKIEEYSLEFDGVYFNDSSGRGDNIYLRFYENGGAVFVILTDNPDPRHVFPHLTGSNQKAYKGNYRITEDNICVTVSYGDVSIKLNGKLSKGKGFDVDIVFVRAGTAVDKSVNIWLAYAQQIYLDHNLSHEMLKTFLDPSGKF